MIIDRYIIREISKPALLICTTLVGIFGCFIAARYLEESVQGQLPGSVVILLILLRIVIALEVLLPTTMYLSVMIAFGRLYRDSEMTSLFACGLSMARVLRPVFFVAIMAGLMVACLSLYIRPWAWNQFYGLKARAEANFDITRMKSKNFYELEGGQKIIFADAFDDRTNQAKHIFMQIRRYGKMQIIYAQAANQYPQDMTMAPVLVLQNARLYEFSEIDENACEISQFGTLAMPLLDKEAVPPEQKVKGVSSEQLMHSRNPEEIAELQWRLTTPISTLLLAILGALLSRSSPRQGKYAKVPLGILVFAAYFTLSAITKKWVGQEVLASMPGIWWTQLFLIGLLLVLWWQSPFLFRLRSR